MSHFTDIARLNKVRLGSGVQHRNTGVILDTRVHGPCSRAPVHTTREHGPWERVMCTEHPWIPAVFAGAHTASFDHTWTPAVSTKSIAPQCFLPTRPVDMGARYTVRKPGVVFATREHRPSRRAVRLLFGSKQGFSRILDSLSSAP